MTISVKNAVPRQFVLLIEDDERAVELARNAAIKTCPEIDLRVLESVEVALDWLEAEPKEVLPSVIVLDLKLPKLDGLAVLRKLRMHQVTRDVPVVVFSDNFTHDDVLLSYRVGANTFLNKPLDLGQFCELMGERLRYWTQPRQHETQ